MTNATTQVKHCRKCNGVLQQDKTRRGVSIFLCPICNAAKERNESQVVKRQNKFNNKRVISTDGHKFDSKWESRVYDYLLTKQRAGLISELELQVPFKLTVCEVVITEYVADFCYFDKETNTREVLDAKGVETDVFRMKSKLMFALYNIRVKIWKASSKYPKQVNL